MGVNLPLCDLGRSGDLAVERSNVEAFCKTFAFASLLGVKEALKHFVDGLTVKLIDRTVQVTRLQFPRRRGRRGFKEKVQRD